MWLERFPTTEKLHLLGQACVFNTCLGKEIMHHPMQNESVASRRLHTTWMSLHKTKLFHYIRAKQFSCKTTCYRELITTNTLHLGKKLSCESWHQQQRSTEKTASICFRCWQIIRTVLDFFALPSCFESCFSSKQAIGTSFYINTAWSFKLCKPELYIKDDWWNLSLIPFSQLLR